MRQLFNWRFVAAVAALAGLVLSVSSIFVVDEDPFASVIDTEVVDRRVDFIAAVDRLTMSDDFELGPDGATSGILDLSLTNGKVMRIAPGTLGDIDCRLGRISRCVVFADLLGDAVIWFGLRTRADRETVELPPILDLEDGYALFENGWQIKYPPVIDRVCEGEDIVSFSDFLRRFGPNSTTVIDVAAQEVLRVRCAGQTPVDDSTTTTIEPVDVPVQVDGEPVPGGEIDENDGILDVPTTVDPEADESGNVTGNLDDLSGDG